jgi:hypothetical protein
VRERASSEDCNELLGFVIANLRYLAKFSAFLSPSSDMTQELMDPDPSSPKTLAQDGKIHEVRNSIETQSDELENVSEVDLDTVNVTTNTKTTEIASVEIDEPEDDATIPEDDRILRARSTRMRNAPAKFSGADYSSNRNPNKRKSKNKDTDTLSGTGAGSFTPVKDAAKKQDTKNTPTNAKTIHTNGNDIVGGSVIQVTSTVTPNYHETCDLGLSHPVAGRSDQPSAHDRTVEPEETPRSALQKNDDICSLMSTTSMEEKQGHTAQQYTASFEEHPNVEISNQTLMPKENVPFTTCIGGHKITTTATEVEATKFLHQMNTEFSFKPPTTTARCSICEKVGHNSSKCPLRIALEKSLTPRIDKVHLQLSRAIEALQKDLVELKYDNEILKKDNSDLRAHNAEMKGRLLHQENHHPTTINEEIPPHTESNSVDSYRPIAAQIDTYRPSYSSICQGRQARMPTSQFNGRVYTARESPEQQAHTEEVANYVEGHGSRAMNVLVTGPMPYDQIANQKHNT